MYKYLIILLLLPVMAGADLYVLTADSLPWTSYATNDTVKIAGDSITATGHGINLNHKYCVILGENKVLRYNSGGSDGVEGVYVSGSCCIIRDLTIREARDTLTTSSGNDVIEIATGVDSLDIINCTLVAYSRDTRCIDSYGSYAKNILIDSCHIWNYCHYYDNRQYYDGAAVRLEIRDPDIAEGDFSAKIYRSVVHLSAHMGIALMGKVNPTESYIGRLQNSEIAYCSTYVDHRNTKYECDDGTTGHGSANAYGIAMMYDDGTCSIHDCYIGAGTKYGGSRGLFIEGSYGTASDTTKIYNNVIDIHCGRDQRYGPARDCDDCGGNCGGSVHAWAVRIRDIDSVTAQYIEFYDNEVTLTLKGVNDTIVGLAYGWMGAVLCISETDRNGGNTHDAHYYFHGNELNIIADSNAAACDGEVVRFTATYHDETIKFWDNKYTGVSEIFNIYQGAGMRFETDTFAFQDDTNNAVTFSLGNYAYPCTNIVVTDAWYCSPADSLDTLYNPGSQSLDITRTGGTVTDCSASSSSGARQKLIRSKGVRSK